MDTTGNIPSRCFASLSVLVNHWQYLWPICLLNNSLFLHFYASLKSFGLAHLSSKYLPHLLTGIFYHIPPHTPAATLQANVASIFITIIEHLHSIIELCINYSAVVKTSYICLTICWNYLPIKNTHFNKAAY